MPEILPVEILGVAQVQDLGWWQGRFVVSCAAVRETLAHHTRCLACCQRVITAQQDMPSSACCCWRHNAALQAFCTSLNWASNLLVSATFPMLLAGLGIAGKCRGRGGAAHG